MADRLRRNAAPRLETLEGRELLSTVTFALAPDVPHLSSRQVGSIAMTRAHSIAGQVSARATTTNANGVYIGNTGPNAGVVFPASPILGQGTPTVAELARESFVGRFSGPMSVEPGRFSDQKRIIFMRGLGGAPKFFLHGDYSLAIVIPADPSLPTTGFAFLDDKNNNSGAVVGLDLLADPTSFDRQGRPTRLTFTADPNVYGGIFFVDSAVGTVHITYGKNSSTSVFAGRIYTSGLTSPFENVDLYAKHSG